MGASSGPLVWVADHRSASGHAELARDRASTAVLDAMENAVILLDAHDVIVHANVSGVAMLARRKPLANVGGKLIPTSLHARNGLVRLLNRAKETEPGSSMTILIHVEEGVALLGDYLALKPMETGASEASGEAAGALVIRPMRFALPGSANVLAQIYRLTPREMATLAAIVDGGGIRDAARRLGVSAHTLRTHLGSVFAKTGAKRQCDLVKLVASTMGPF